MNSLFARKLLRIASRKADAAIGRFWPLKPTLKVMAARPYELHLELTNLCNANCIFCPYQFQTRPIETMGDEVFAKAIADYAEEGGGQGLSVLRFARLPVSAVQSLRQAHSSSSSTSGYWGGASPTTASTFG